MLFSTRSVSLSPIPFDKDEVALIPSFEWMTLQSECDDYHEIDGREALWLLDTLHFNSDILDDMRFFLAYASIGSFPLDRMDNQDVLRAIRETIRDGDVITVQKGKAKTEKPSATVEMRRLVSAIEKSAQGRLNQSQDSSADRLAAQRICSHGGRVSSAAQQKCSHGGRVSSAAQQKCSHGGHVSSAALRRHHLGQKILLCTRCAYACQSQANKGRNDHA